MRLLPKRLLTRLLLVSLVVFMVIIGPTRLGLPWPQAAVQAQMLRRVNPVAIATQIYQQLPELPQENHYLDRSSGQPAIEDTLISRMIRYHLYVKNRPAIFRLDWKLTLADYLGAFERIQAQTYPSAETLTVNPLEGDRAAVAGISRDQRNALVQHLVDHFRGPAP